MIKEGQIYRYNNDSISELKVKVLSIEGVDVEIEVLDTYWWKYNGSVIRKAGDTFVIGIDNITNEYELVRPLKNTKPDWL